MSINTKLYIENLLKIKDKNSKIIPFKLNQPQQKLYDTIKELKQQHKPVRIIILKARQMGFSTLTEAILFKETATKHNVTSGIIAHENKATNNLFNMSKLYYDNLPEPMKPQLQNRNAQELIFNNPTNTGLNSKIICMTADKDAGRSGTYNFLHLSEFAFWQGNKEEAFTSIMQTVPNNENSIVIIESTANGYEYFKTLWDKAVNKETDFVPVFVGWNELTEYSIPYTGFKKTEEEITLQKNYELTDDQLEWRRWCIRNNCAGDIKKFNQEYPICPEEAFISSGNCVFDTEIIHKRLGELQKPIKQGWFEYDYDDTLPAYGRKLPNGSPYPAYKINNIKWHEDKNGYIKIYELPDSPVVTNYAIGGDTAGSGSDYFVAHVINVATMSQVATLRHQMNADLYAKQVYCLAMYYKQALVGIESNFDSYPIKELERLGYRHQYIRKNENKINGRSMQEYGFRTDMRTRPEIISNLQTFVREYPQNINDRDTLAEMLEFIYNKDMRPEAQEGSHDDLVMALAISLKVREQAYRPTPAIEMVQDTFYKSDMNYSSKEKIIVV